MKKIEFKGVKFLAIVSFIYIILFIFDFENGLIVLQKFLDIITKLLPIFIFIIILTTIINYFLQPKKVMKHFGKDSGKKGIFYMLMGGTLSHGPMYAWYGMLEDMRKNGLKDGLIVVFLYARAIKLPLLPFMVEIFGIVFTVVINIYILIFAIVQGKVMDIFKNKNIEKIDTKNKKEEKMAEKVLACDNEICKEKDNCERYRLFKEGAKEYKTHNGKEHKGCGQFIKNTK